MSAVHTEEETTAAIYDLCNNVDRRKGNGSAIPSLAEQPFHCHALEIKTCKRDRE